jgi:exodeoxyribonuclease V alpha subunit
MNRGGLGARSLNAELQLKLNEKEESKVTRFGSTFAPGDKVIQTVNNYDKEVFNGDIGRILEIDQEEGTLIVDYDDRSVEYELGELEEISLAYATSIHKSQGSEYPAVVIPLAMQHYTLLERNLIYTAVTRGKKLVMIIDQPKALAMAVKNLKSTKWQDICVRIHCRHPVSLARCKENAAFIKKHLHEHEGRSFEYRWRRCKSDCVNNPLC